MPLTPERAALLGRLGAFNLHGKGKTNTAPARAAFMSKFVIEAQRIAEEQGERIDMMEAERRAKYLRQAHFARMRLMRHKKTR